MKKKKGFTLIELLGVIIVLAIVMGLAVVAYIGLNGQIDETYYHGLEESLKMAGADYFYYNKGEAPKIFGDQKEVTAKTLQENKYMQDGIKDKDGKNCDLEESKVLAYKDKSGTTSYHSCLVCGEYRTSENDAVCRGEVDYTLRVRGKKESTNENYNLDEISWSNKNIIVTFETANDINTVYVKGAGTTKSCNLQSKGIVKTCDIKLEATGTYTYNFDDQNKDDEKSLSVKIDKVAPTFTLSTSSDQHIAITGDSTTINNTIQNATDNDSKIKMIEYSFEEEGKSDYYKKLDLGGKDNNITLTISKTLNRKKYKLKVRVYDNADNVSDTKIILYDIYKRVSAPSSGSYCRSGLVYNGYSQNLVYSAGEGYTFSGTTATNAGYHTVYAYLKEGYRWNDDTTSSKSMSCYIDKATVSFYLSPSYDSIEVGDSTSFSASASVYGSFSNSSYSSIISISASKYSSSETVYVYGNSSGSASVTVYFTPNDTTNYYTPSSRSYSISVTSPPPPPVDPDPVYPSTPKTVSYTVNYYGVDNNGVQTSLQSPYYGSGTVGSTVTGPTPTFSGYDTPSPISIVLSEYSSDNVIDYYYYSTYDGNRICATFDGNGASVSQSTVCCNALVSSKGCDVTAPNITRSGYTILGFATTKSSHSGSKAPGSTINITKAKTYYAVTYKTVTLTVDVNQPSGATGSSLKIPGTQSANIYNTSTSATVTITADNSNYCVYSNSQCAGWKLLGFSDYSSGSASYYIGGSIKLTSDKTIYAVWEPVQTSFKVKGATDNSWYQYGKTSSASRQNSVTVYCTEQTVRKTGRHDIKLKDGTWTCYGGVIEHVTYNGADGFICYTDGNKPQQFRNASDSCNPE